MGRCQPIQARCVSQLEAHCHFDTALLSSTKHQEQFVAYLGPKAQQSMMQSGHLSDMSEGDMDYCQKNVGCLR